jgi:ADP-ribose pyrophosphatase YjhB (NUDIX family)
LVRRARPPAKGKWDIPGGFLEEGEHPVDGVRRELGEELGLEVGELQLVDCSINLIGAAGERGAVLDILYECELSQDASPVARDDVDAIMWVAISRLPELPRGEWAFEASANAALRWKLRRGD